MVVGDEREEDRGKQLDEDDREHERYDRGVVDEGQHDDQADVQEQAQDEDDEAPAHVDHLPADSVDAPDHALPLLRRHGLAQDAPRERRGKAADPELGAAPLVPVAAQVHDGAVGCNGPGAGRQEVEEGRAPRHGLRGDRAGLVQNGRLRDEGLHPLREPEAGVAQLALRPLGVHGPPRQALVVDVSDRPLAVASAEQGAVLVRAVEADPAVGLVLSRVLGHLAVLPAPPVHDLRGAEAARRRATTAASARRGQHGAGRGVLPVPRRLLLVRTDLEIGTRITRGLPRGARPLPLRDLQPHFPCLNNLLHLHPLSLRPRFTRRRPPSRPARWPRDLQRASERTLRGPPTEGSP
mmetsp:Transcript_10074/g.28553  ORF Transcript_10074/g.28553 Transcript_10074/m.28553 type:complete len:352 (-) Transcript_10074:228-1283(-)